MTWRSVTGFDLTDVTTSDGIDDVRTIAGEVVGENYGEALPTRMSRMAQWIVARLAHDHRPSRFDKMSSYFVEGVGTVWRAAALVELDDIPHKITAREARLLATALLEAADDADAAVRGA